MKKIIVLVLVLLLGFSLFASPFNDFAIMLGNGNYHWDGKGIGLSYGLTLGLSARTELRLRALSEITPKPFGSNLIILEAGVSLLGKRSTGSKVAGDALNMLLTVGGFYTTENQGCGIILGLTPLIIGSPILGRREHLLRTDVGWDFRNKKLIVALSLGDFDFYLKGTNRDYS